MKLSNKVQLITYADSLGKNLKDLKKVLDKHFKGYINGVHILPFYPSSGDRGFAPLTHKEVDKKFGTWNDIRNISKDYELMADFVLNHISAQSEYFQDYLKNGDESEYSDMFLTLDKVFPEGVDIEQLDMIYRPRPTEPFKDFFVGKGVRKRIWISFTQEQIDIDWGSPVTREIMKDFLESIIREGGARVLRLDAVGYIVKKRGTNSFFIPEVYDILEWVRKIAVEYGVKLLLEVHYHYSLQLELSKKADYVYDFALPMITLYSLFYQNSVRLKEWIEIRPNNCFTTLDTHDGIGITDVRDLLSNSEIQDTVERLYEKGGNALMRATGLNSKNLDIYQINCTYYSALGCDDNQYLIARAIQFFLPGIPQVYYVGLLAGENDEKLLAKTKHGRDINRHNYSLPEIEKEVKRPVVQKLLQLIKFRNEYEAFNGEFSVEESDKESIRLKWTKEHKWCELEVNFKNYRLGIKYIDEDKKEKIYNL